MPEEDTRSMLLLIEERIRSSAIEVQHRDLLIRLQSMIEEDLEAVHLGAVQSEPTSQRPKVA